MAYSPKKNIYDDDEEFSSLFDYLVDEIGDTNDIEIHGLNEGELQQIEIIKEKRRQCLNQILNVNESILKTQKCMSHLIS